MPKPQKAHVAYAIVDFAEGTIPPTDWREAFLSSLVPGTRVTRYGRRWYLTRFDKSRRWLRGKLAFESAGDDSGIWDEQTKDVRVIAGAVQSVPYVVDLSERRVAFELRSQTVAPGTFQGNFQALLQEASGHPWRVTLEGVEQPPWEEWQARVERLVRIHLSLKPPNPHSPAEELEEAFEEANVNALTIGATGENIQLENSELLQAAFGHSRDYGKVTATGIVRRGRRTEEQKWTTAAEAGVVKDATLPDESGRVPQTEMERLLARRAKQTKDSTRERE